MSAVAPSSVQLCPLLPATTRAEDRVIIIIVIVTIIITSTEDRLALVASTWRLELVVSTGRLLGGSGGNGDSCFSFF